MLSTPTPDSSRRLTIFTRHLTSPMSLPFSTRPPCSVSANQTSAAPDTKISAEDVDWKKKALEVSKKLAKEDWEVIYNALVYAVENIKHSLLSMHCDPADPTYIKLDALRTLNHGLPLKDKIQNILAAQTGNCDEFSLLILGYLAKHAPHLKCIRVEFRPECRSMTNPDHAVLIAKCPPGTPSGNWEDLKNSGAIIMDAQKKEMYSIPDLLAGKPIRAIQTTQTTRYEVVMRANRTRYQTTADTDDFLAGRGRKPNTYGSGIPSICNTSMSDEDYAELQQTLAKIKQREEKEAAALAATSSPPKARL